MLPYVLTGFLFNHTQVMRDQTVNSFGRDVWAGTPMERVPQPAETAQNVVIALGDQYPDATLNWCRASQFVTNRNALQIESCPATGLL